MMDDANYRRLAGMPVSEIMAENERLRDMLRDAMAAMLLVRRCGNGGAKLSREASDAVRSWLATHSTTQ